MNLFDASALLAYLNDEQGSDVVERELVAGGLVSAVNWSEVAQKVQSAGGDWPLARSLLMSFGLGVEPVLAVDGERAAGLWRRGSGLSLADRICLATRERLQATAWTADTGWTPVAGVRQVRS